MGWRGSSACAGATMQRMPARFMRTVPAGLVAVAIVLSAAGCLEDPAPTVTPRPASSSTSPSGTAGPDPTPVPVPVTPGPTEEPEPVPTQVGVTDTPWGAIVDEIPADWPVFPGAEAVEPDEGPASGAWLAPADVDPVARWHRDALSGMGFSTDNLSSPLEDGTRILDIVTDLPECRIQVTFRPVEGSTMITVLYGAGCAGGDA
jgi:hypothetical protein